MSSRSDSAKDYYKRPSGSSSDGYRAAKQLKPSSATATGANAIALGGIDQSETAPFAKSNFGLSGALAKDQRTGTTVTVDATTGETKASKYAEPTDACGPVGSWRVFVFKGEECVETLYLHRKGYFILGREEELSDIVIAHPSCSKEHAALQYRKTKKGPALYVIDLDSTNGTLLNGSRIVASHYVEIMDGDVLNFGQSTRDYVFKRASETST